jgi:2-C-methyl-D-erythritol 4-phosphate cytidylyltransferase
LKRAGADNRVEATVSRSHLWRALTPQMFRFGLLRQALEQCGAGDASITDEAAAVESLGVKPLLVPGRSDNIKITTAEDVQMASRFLANRVAG